METLNLESRRVITISKATARKNKLALVLSGHVTYVPDSHKAVLAAMALAGMGPDFARDIAESMGL